MCCNVASLQYLRWWAQATARRISAGGTKKKNHYGRCKVLEPLSFQIFSSQLDEALTDQLWLEDYPCYQLGPDQMIPSSFPTSAILWSMKHFQGLNSFVACYRSPLKLVQILTHSQPTAKLSMALDFPLSVMLCRESRPILSASASFWPKYTSTLLLQQKPRWRSRQVLQGCFVRGNVRMQGKFTRASA